MDFRFLPEISFYQLKVRHYYLVHIICLESKVELHFVDFFHTDVCTMQSNNLGGALYYVTFIDDYSRKVWAYALKSKDQVLDVFSFFLAA